MPRIVYAPRLRSRLSRVLFEISPLKLSWIKVTALPARCIVNLDDITTLPKALIKQRITALSTEKIQQVEQAIRFALDLD
jgi:PemK-like, MazF-like toxin of type II toxin-antitoxin system